jgi:hypothetical protein
VIGHQSQLLVAIRLFRQMARHFGIEGTGDKMLSPSLLQLLVNRYDKDLDSRFSDYYDRDPELVDHFNVARYVCKRLCEFDYRNYIWSVDGKDVNAPGGKSLRIMHPFYPGEAPYEHITAQETKSFGAGGESENVGGVWYNS